MTEVGNVKKVTDTLEVSTKNKKNNVYNEVNTEPEDNFVRRSLEKVLTLRR